MLCPVRTTCSATLVVTPGAIASTLLDLDQWPSFTGYGPLPGIRSARFLARTPGVVGSRIAVVNTDGSTHTEEILEWDPERAIRLRLGGFSRPLRWFADHFDEAWAIEPHADGTTTVVRTFELHPRGWWGVPVLWVVRPLLRRAVMRSMAAFQTDPRNPGAGAA